jgi:uncharacterized membrane protein YcaP (DUF421 family)
MLELDLRVLGEIAIRAALVYLALVLLLRLAGKRELGQLNLFDLIVILLIANAVQNAMVGPDTSLTGGLVAAATVVGLNAVVDRLSTRVGWLGRELIGSPTLLVNDGKLIEEYVRREGLTADVVEMALREHGVAQVSDAQMAVLETDGTISVIPRDVPVYRSRRRMRGRKPLG